MSEQLPEITCADPVAWCERNIQLDYGYFKRENHPLIVEPLRAAAEGRGKYVGLIGSVQHIKTLCAQLFQLYGLHVMPCNAAHYDLTGDALKEFSDDKFTPLIDNTDEITRLIPDQPHRRTKFYTSSPLGYVRLLSAGIMANRNSKTLERITADESWAYKDSEKWLEQIHSRQSSFNWQWQMFLPSSGQTASSELDLMWRRSSQRTWHVKCDCCGEDIPYIWKMPAVNGVVPAGGIRYASKNEITDDDGNIDWAELRKSVYYQCQLCGGHMPWSAGDQQRRNLSGRYIALNPNADESVDFYSYNAIAHFPWPELVTAWKRAAMARDTGDLSGLEEFVRKRLAQPWNQSDYLSGDKIEKACGGYVLGEAWVPGSNAAPIFATVDVQKDHYYVVVRQWATIDNQFRSRLLERERVVSTSQIRDLADKWEIPQESVGSRRVFLDGNYNTAEVQRIAADNNWVVFRGDKAKDFMDSNTGTRRMFDHAQRVDTFLGLGDRPGALGRVAYQVRFSKSTALNTLMILRSLRDNDEKPIWTYANNAGTTYERQINAWQKVSKTKPDGSAYFDFINRDSHNDHFGDCEIMNVVCAAMAGLIGASNAETVEDSGS